jgi:hypothetical protein
MQTVIIENNEIVRIERQPNTTLVIDRDPYIFSGERDTAEQIRDKLNSLPDGFAYIHNQLTPSSAWIINHNLGYQPTTELRNTGGLKIYAEIIHVSDNQIQVLSDTPIAGQLRLT